MARPTRLRLPRPPPSPPAGRGLPLRPAGPPSRRRSRRRRPHGPQRHPPHPVPAGSLAPAAGPTRHHGLGAPLGIVGRLTPWKGQDIVLRVAAQWAKSGRPGRFAIIGGAFNEDAPFEAHLREFVQSHGLAGRVHFVPFQPDIASAISSLDVLVHASTKPEPFGRVLIEAMALGVPVVAARGGGVPEIVTDAVDGLLVPPGDVAGTTHALERLLGDPAFQTSIVEAGSRTVRDKFSMERVFTDWHALLSEASNRNAP